MIKVWWHCLTKTFANMRGEEHYICSITGWKDDVSIGIVWPAKTYFCSCGYNKER